MSEELILLNDNGWHDDYSVSSAVRYVANEGEETESNIEAVALMIAAILETMPPAEILRVLNAGSRRVWRIAP